MELKRFVVGFYQSNTYILIKDYDAMIIDPGGPVHEVIHLLESKGLRLKLIYITHGHIDHIGGVNELKKRYKDTAVYAPIKDRYWYAKNPAKGLEEDLIVDQFVNEGDSVYFGGLDFKVIETPGHSYGSTCLYSSQAEILFSGDTLFKRSIGRTDNYLGDFDTIISSIRKKLFTLPKKTQVFPGHGAPTTIEDEIKYNPFLNK